MLDLPFLYLASQSIVGAKRGRRICVEHYLKPTPGSRVLDIGCGPGYVVEYLPQVDYVGYDTDAAYIRYATRRYGDRGRFVCGQLSASDLIELGQFDFVMLMGVLHHLSENDARTVLDLAHRALRPGGRLVALEGCYVPGQNAIARLLLDKDRGKFVRSETEYRRLAEQAFESVAIEIRHDLFLVPYTNAVITCLKHRT